MLQIKHISKQYQTGDLIQQALNDVSLNLRDSEFVAILGPSGSGKTTLLNIIGGLDRYDDGDLIINGISTKQYRDRNWDSYRNHSIGFVFQSYNLIPHQTVLSNVELALTISGISGAERKVRAMRALQQVGLGEQLHKKPNQMSGGQMQRVALARALVNDPDILLADEPTGALDTETSRQVMELMKEVAQDRLVVMVTHNPELAEEYASRIVRLRDGKVTDDTMPFTDEEVMAAEAAAMETSAEEPSAAIPAAGVSAAAVTGAATGAAASKDAAQTDFTGLPKKNGKQKLTSMSFLTSLALSFSNLRTKKGRTILTSFAGSIGIIGIALILSLSNGVNDYIAKVQHDTMASYPITVNASSLDFFSLLESGNDNFKNMAGMGEDQEQGKVKVNFSDVQIGSSFTGNLKQNNLSAFKEYLDDPKSEIHRYIGENGIVYTYNVDFKVYSYDEKGRLLDTEADPVSEFNDENNILGNLLEARSLMLDNMSTMFGGSSAMSKSNFGELMGGADGETVSQVVKDSYDLVYGTWPENYDEVVLVMDASGTMDSVVLYQLGILPREEFRKAVKQAESDEELDPVYLDYPSVCGKEFLLLTKSGLYRKNSNGTFSRIKDDEKSLKEVLNNAVKLKVTGLIKPSKDASVQSISQAVGYTTKLTDYMIQHNQDSEIIQAQQDDPEKNVLSGQAFEKGEPSDAVKAAKAQEYLKDMNEKEKADMFMSLMTLDYEGGMESLMTVQMKAISGQIGSRMQEALSEAVGGVIASGMEQFLSQIQNALQETVKDGMEGAMRDILEGAMQQIMEKVMPSVSAEIMKEVGATLAEEVMPQIMSQVMPGVMKEIMSQAAPEVMNQVMQQFMPTVMEQLMPKIEEKAKANFSNILKQTVQLAIQKNVQSMMQTIQSQLSDSFPAELQPFLNITSWDDFVKKITETDFSAIDFNNIDTSKLDFSKMEFQPVNLSDLDFSSLMPTADDLKDLDLSKLDFSKIDLSKIDLSKLDFSKIDLSKLDLSKIKMDKIDLSKLDLSDIDFSELDLSGLDLSKMDFSQIDLGSVDFSNMDFSNLDLSGLASVFEGISISMDEKEMAETVNHWLTEVANQKKLCLVYDRFIGETSYNSNLSDFGYVSYDAPSTISLYADTFEGKDGIAASIQKYNAEKEKDDQIVYTDYVALLTSSITTIIDAISYVLIGFVGVSLFVSCIMIGVITNISVLERTKEIGVLRALGASKRNISNVFNAETFIIGCLSGLIGVGISLLLILPINAIVHALMDSSVLSAKLPFVSALILIAISVAITIIGGLIPATKASNKDPVEALRSE